MPYYTRNGKIQTPMSDEEFFRTLEEKKLKLGVKKTGYVAFLFYFGVRVSEALKMKPENFTIVGSSLFVDIGKRLKHSKTTSPLSVELNRPFVDEIVKSVERTNPNRRIWSWSRTTAWKIITKTFDRYPHYFRLNRITNLFDKGFKISQVQNWTGLTLSSLNHYIGTSDTREIGKTSKFYEEADLKVLYNCKRF